VKKIVIDDKKRELILRVLLWLFAIGVIGLNFSLIFDNVLWGDEAFSANVIRDTGAYGIFQRIYYWDTHPPLYYYYLKLIAMAFGYTVPVYHFASIFPFALGIILGCVFLPKKIGTIPTAFLVLFAGLSATCVEYNLEVRMYSIAFLFTGLTLFFSTKIINNGEKVHWVLMTIFAVLAAYSHYYGAMTTGIIIFYTSLFYFLMNRKKTWIYGVCSVAGYFALYSPSMNVLLRQTKAEVANTWMKAPDSLNQICTFICGGERFKNLVLPILIAFSIIEFILQSGLCTFKFHSKSEVLIKLNKPDFKRLSIDHIIILLCWLVIISELGLAYLVSYLVIPVLTSRYTYMLIPPVITVFVLLIKKYINRVNMSRLGLILIYILFAVMLVMGLLDFKYFRSVTKVQNVNLSEVLSIVGEPTETTVLADNGVPHLSYTIFQYYYPDTAVIDTNMEGINSDIREVEEEKEIKVDNIWLFRQTLMSEAEISVFENQGYKVECYPDKWFGKYYCNIYRMHKN